MAVDQQLLEEFTAIDNYIRAAREALAAGIMPDMTGLDKRVTDLCWAIKQSDIETKQVCLPKLTEMVENLNDCEKQLRAFHEARGKGNS